VVFRLLARLLEFVGLARRFVEVEVHRGRALGRNLSLFASLECPGIPSV